MGTLINIVVVTQFVIIYGSGTPNPEVEEQQRDDVFLLIGDQIMDLIERPNAGPDDVDIEDVTVEEDSVKDPDKNE